MNVAESESWEPRLRPRRAVGCALAGMALAVCSEWAAIALGVGLRSLWSAGAGGFLYGIAGVLLEVNSALEAAFDRVRWPWFPVAVAPPLVVLTGRPAVLSATFGVGVGLTAGVVFCAAAFGFER